MLLRVGKERKRGREGGFSYVFLADTDSWSKGALLLRELVLSFFPVLTLLCGERAVES